MTKNSELYTRKFFFTSKLTLALVLSFIIIRTALLPDRIAKTLASASAPGGDQVSVNETVNLSDLQSADYAEIVERNPFGISGQTTGANKWASFRPAVSEELGLALFGTVSGSPEVARAIIKNLKTGVFGLYRIGQTVEGARIQDIETDEVILARNGERKILRLSMAQANNSYDGIKTSLSGTVDEISNAAETDLAHTDALTRIGYVEAILNKAVIEPHIVDGQVDGLKITAIENIKEAKELGLKNGDVIRTVNGHRLTSKQKAHQIFKKTSSQKAINLELLRNGETENLSFDLR
ncbi:MAG: type II secretion system protein N [Phycisphaerae bacterium]|jgi:general secretion pathway protein C